jgi:hypothetical protein
MKVPELNLKFDRKVERPERIAELINEVRTWPVDDVVDLMEKIFEIPLEIEHET